MSRNIIKKVKALADRPGTPEEGKAVEEIARQQQSAKAGPGRSPSQTGRQGGSVFGKGEGF
jgi:hypothetical protein